jgi:hypothetical protein
VEPFRSAHWDLGRGPRYEVPGATTVTSDSLVAEGARFWGEAANTTAIVETCR